MADTTKIEWTDATWNPITGCTLVDDGCRNCYAARLAATRLKHHPSRGGLARLNADGVAKFTGEVRFNRDWLTQPLKWRKPRMIFVCAHGDLFHPNVPDDWIDQVFAVMALCPEHTFQVLTKRPERAAAYMNNAQPFIRILDWMDKMISFGSRQYSKWPLPNVWLGTSVSDQASADQRIPHLLNTPAAVRFVSAEPLLGPVDFRAITAAAETIRPYRANIDALDGTCQSLDHDSDDWFLLPSKLDWIICGGESGPNARPMHPDWARSLRDQCVNARVPFFFKQWGEWGYPDQVLYMTDAPVWRRSQSNNYPIEKIHVFDDNIACQRVGPKAAGRLLDGREWNQMPEDE